MTHRCQAHCSSTAGPRPHQVTGGDRRAKRAGGARRVKAAGLVEVYPLARPMRIINSLPATKAAIDHRQTATAFLGYRESGWQYRGAGMSPGTRAA